MMRAYLGGTSYEMRTLVDLISRPEFYGAFASEQADDMAKAAVALAPMLRGYRGFGAWLGFERRSPVPRAKITPLGSCRASLIGSSC